MPTPGIAVSGAPVNVIADEAGACYASGRYTLRLTSRPTHNVTLTLALSHRLLVVTPSAITFAPVLWNNTYQIVVCASQLSSADTSIGVIHHNVTSLDPFYDDGGLTRTFPTPNATVRVTTRFDGLPAPELKTTRFIDSGVGLLVKFDRATNLAGLSGTWPCGRLFNDSASGPAGYLGKDPTCIWVDSESVQLTFGCADSAVATAAPGGKLMLVGKRLQSTFPGASLYSPAQNITLAPAQSPVQPVASISAPEAVGLCDGVFLDAGLSSGSGGRDMLFNWSVAAARGSEVSQLLNITHLLAEATQLGSATVTIPRSAFPPKTTLSVSLTVINYLGAHGSTTVQVSKGALPAPLAIIQGTNPSTTVRSNELKLMLSAWQPIVCDGRTLKSGKMDFVWSELTGRFLKAGGSLTTINPRVLTIPPFILTPHQTYEFEAFVSMRDDPNMNASTGMTVYVAPQPLAAAIADGDTREVGEDAWLYLDASPSVDPDGMNSSFHYTWSCITCLRRSSLHREWSAKRIMSASFRSRQACP